MIYYSNNCYCCYDYHSLYSLISVARSSSLSLQLDSISAMKQATSTRTIQSTPSKSLKLNIIRSTDLTPTTTAHQLLSDISTGDKVQLLFMRNDYKCAHLLVQ